MASLPPASESADAPGADPRPGRVGATPVSRSRHMLSREAVRGAPTSVRDLREGRTRAQRLLPRTGRSIGPSPGPPYLLRRRVPLPLVGREVRARRAWQSSLRLMPSGVSAKAQAKISAMGKPGTTSAITSLVAQFGISSTGNVAVRSGSAARPRRRRRRLLCRRCVASARGRDPFGSSGSPMAYRIRLLHASAARAGVYAPALRS